ncbi:hypothetical protein SUGI_0303180 [Cryptomeria japonica]|nr:hypothetical protein SUGI_0303180 [Cryptomeria japonica]
MARPKFHPCRLVPCLPLRPNSPSARSLVGVLVRWRKMRGSWQWTGAMEPIQKDPNLAPASTFKDRPSDFKNSFDALAMISNDATIVDEAVPSLRNNPLFVDCGASALTSSLSIITEQCEGNPLIIHRELGNNDGEIESGDDIDTPTNSSTKVNRQGHLVGSKNKSTSIKKKEGKAMPANDSCPHPAKDV